MAISISDITKSFGTQKALDGVSFEVGTGELIGLLGPNGAGKSTMMKIITGYLAADRGRVTVNGEKVDAKNIVVRRQLGYLPENNPLYTDLYVKEYLDVVAGFYRLTNKKERIETMIELTGLKSEQHKKIGALSKGYKQRVGLAQALIHDPSVLILDEPTTGLDPNQLEEIRQLIKAISREKTVILSTHVMQEVEAVCSRVVIINKGQLVADGTVDQLKSGRFGHSQSVWIEFDRAVSPQVISEVRGIQSVHPVRERVFVAEASGDWDIRPELFRFAVRNDLIILTIREQQQSLEAVFQEITKN